MARLNTYTRTSQPSDSDVFVIDSTTGSAGTRTVLWSSIKALFAAAKHSHAASDITSGTLALDRLPTIANATKATQDSAGQTINTTYVKSVTASGRTVTVTKGNGTTSTFTTQDTTYSEATQSTAGLMSAADKTKLDGLSGDYGSSIGVATSSKDGLMSKTDKAKLDKFPSDGMTRISEATIDGMF